MNGRFKILSMVKACSQAILVLILIGFYACIDAQNPVNVVSQNGGILTEAIINEKGDTIPYVELSEFVVVAPKFFATAEDYKRYERYRRYAPTVVPFAIEAVRTYRSMESATRDMKERDRKKYIAQLQKELGVKMEAQLKLMTVTQGLLLTKMIEKELHMPFYDLVKDVKGGFSAFYWNQFGKIYGYHLKDGYVIGQDPVLDAVLQQFNVAYAFR